MATGLEMYSGIRGFPETPEERLEPVFDHTTPEYFEMKYKC